MYLGTTRIQTSTKRQGQFSETGFYIMHHICSICDMLDTLHNLVRTYLLLYLTDSHFLLEQQEALSGIVNS